MSAPAAANASQPPPSSALPAAAPQALSQPPVQHIAITAGSLSQSHTILGVVQVDTKGLSLRPSEQVNARLRWAAWQKWGLWVDAIIHVTYHNEPGGDIYVSGVAVHVLEPYRVRL